METFEREWLRLRERYDHTDRSGRLAARFAAAVGANPCVLDLGCGTGSNLRYLAPRLGADQSWLCLDHDPALLEVAASEIAAWGERRGLVHERPGPVMRLRGRRTSLDVSLIVRDLSDPRRAFGLDEVDGLTASAFLDLVSSDWVDGLVGRVSKTPLPLLFALSYDGRMEWRPEAEDDALVRERFNRHQRTDKGFGEALGPDATSALADRLGRFGFAIRLSKSDWRLDGSDRPLLEAFMRGLIGAVREIEDDARLAAWSEHRSRQLARGELDLTVGHLDFLALPA